MQTMSAIGLGSDAADLESSIEQRADTLALQLQVRSDLVISQVLTAAVTSFAAKVRRRAHW